MCIEDQGVEAIVLCDFGGDVDGALVSKAATKLKVVEREGIVGGFGPVRMDVSLVVLKRYS
jgi:hypothetical protein